MIDLEALARHAAVAADRARQILLAAGTPEAAETKADGTPVTATDRAAERAIRETLERATPDIDVLGEEFGRTGPGSERCWVVDPIDGTIAFTRGIPLYGTLIALLDGDEPVLGLIDVPRLDERTLGWKGGGVTTNGRPVRASTATDLGTALVSHGDRASFDRHGARAVLDRLHATAPRLRGYTDAFGYAALVQGRIDLMVDSWLGIWDLAALAALVPEAGGACRRFVNTAGEHAFVAGAPELVARVADWPETLGLEAR